MKAIIGYVTDQYGPGQTIRQTIGCIIESPQLQPLERMAHGCTVIMDNGLCDRVGINAIGDHPDFPGASASIIFHLDNASSPQTAEALGARLLKLRRWLAEICHATEIQEVAFKSRIELCLYLGEYPFAVR